MASAGGHSSALLPIPCPEVWYFSPYLTCKECNAVSFVDGLALKQALIRDDSAGEGSYLDMEVLPGCFGCGRTHTYVIGARDLSLLIGANAEARERLMSQKRLVASKIQAMHRGRIGRLSARARKAAILAYKKLIFYACTIVQRRYRGYLDRLRFIVEKSLLLIKVRSVGIRPESRRKGASRARGQRVGDSTSMFVCVCVCVCVCVVIVVLVGR